MNVKTIMLNLQSIILVEDISQSYKTLGRPTLLFGRQACYL